MRTGEIDMSDKKNTALWSSVVLALAYLLALGYMTTLLPAAKPSVTAVIALAVLGIAGFAVLLFGIAVAFRGIDALDVQQAFALPRGTVRAVLALGLLVAFLVGSFYWIERAALLNLTQQELPSGAAPDMAKLQESLGPEIVVFLTTEQRQVTDDDGTKRREEVKVLNFINRAANPEWFGLIKQVVTVLSTALAAVIGFYFGSRSSDVGQVASETNGEAEADAGKLMAQIESAREIAKGVAGDVQRAQAALDKIKSSYDAAKRSAPNDMTTALLASAVESAEKAYAKARESESKSRTLLKAIEEAAAKLAVKSTTAEQSATLRQELAEALKGLKQQSVLAKAAGDRALKLVGLAEPAPPAPVPQG